MTFFPGNGTDTHNPWLNNFDWYFGNNTIQLFPNQVNWSHGFSNLNDTINMQHPYGGSMPTEFHYLRPNNVHPELRDFRWEDGWELLYMNLGYFPDMNAINNPLAGSYYANHNQSYDPVPSNIPYFAIYNRYRGLLRLIANVWYPVGSNYSNINVTLQFTGQSGEQNRLTGLLRHASTYDSGLSEKTNIKAIHAPRFHAPNFTQWIVADFQMAYDPCSCQSQGELEFVFTAFNTLDVDIIGRSVAIDVPIDNDNYTTRDFLNLSKINVDSYEPGTEIYQNMDRLALEFEKKQRKYLEDLEEYNQTTPFSLALQKFAVKQVANYLTGGLSGILISDSLLTWVTNDDWRDATSLEDLPIGIEPQMVKNKFADKAKGLIGDTFGFLSTEIFSPAPSKPTPPAVPVATLEESVYKGTITTIDTTYSSPLIVPGSLPNAYPSGTSLEPHRLPVYNEVLGQTALLETPEVEFYLNSDTASNILSYEDEGVPMGGGINCYVTKEFRSKVDFKLKFDEELKVALNNAIDFDYDQTKTYVQVNLKLGNDVDVNTQYLYGPEKFDYYTEIHPATNIYLDRKYVDSFRTKLEFNSKWILLADLNQVVFQLLYQEVFEFTGTSFSYYADDCDIHDPFGLSYFDYELEKLNIKLMHDMYFDQIGTSNKQVNTIQVHTYQLYDQSKGINHLEGDPSAWSEEPDAGVFDQYIPGVLSLGNETITTNHPLVHEVIGTEIFIKAQEVHITGSLQVQPGYTLVVQALEQIRQLPGAVFNPKIQMSIKQSFYNTPVFEYVDNTEVASFCNSTFYQANIDAAAISTRPGNQDQEATKELTKHLDERGYIDLFPNPARDLLNLHSSHKDMYVITIHDLSGRALYQKNLIEHSRTTQIDLSTINSGIYIVKVDCGAEVFTKKLIVAK